MVVKVNPFGEKLGPHQRPGAVANITLAETECAGINRDREHAKPRRPSPGKGRLSRFASADEIKLIPPAPCASGGHIFQPAARYGSQRESDACFRCCARPAHFALGIYQAAESYWRQQEGHG